MNADGNLAVVVGGATGIGSGICRAAVNRGYRVALGDIDEANSSRLVEELGSTNVFYHPVDVTDMPSLAEMEARVRLGTSQIDLLFVNAGIISLKRFLSATDEDWDWVYAVNLFGTVKTLRAFLPNMLAQSSRSRICVTSSLAALRTPPMEGQTMYMSSKAAQLALVSGLRNELEGSNVDLSIIIPSAVESALLSKSESKRAGAMDGTIRMSDSFAHPMSPSMAGENIMAGVQQGRQFIFTHPGQGAEVRAFQQELMKRYD